MPVLAAGCDEYEQRPTRETGEAPLLLRYVEDFSRI